MKHIIEVLRLKYAAKLSHEKIARACGLWKGVVGKYVSHAGATAGVRSIDERTACNANTNCYHLLHCY
jgi:hypothetical protein